MAVSVVVPLEALVDNVRFPCQRAEGGNPVVVTHQFSGDAAGFDVAWPAYQARYAKRALPVRILFTAEVCHCSIGPGIHVRAIVAGVNDDRVVGNSHSVKGVEDFPDRLVMLDHSVNVLAISMGVAPTVFGTDVRSQVHAGGVEPAEERLARFALTLHELDCAFGSLVVDRLHSLFR